MYIEGSVIIFNFFKYGLHCVVLEIFAIKLIALFYDYLIFLRFLEFPQNKVPLFKYEYKYKKYMVLTVFLYTNDLMVLITKFCMI